MKRVMSLFIAVICLTSCSIGRGIQKEAEYNALWKGKSYSEIVMHFGAPDRVEYDGHRGQILVYENFTTTTTTDVDTHFGMFDPDYTTKVRTDKRYIHFFMGEDDTCYLVKSNRTEADPKTKKRFMTIFWSYTGVLSILGLLVPFLIAG
jgi:hypothetical protein